MEEGSFLGPVQNSMQYERVQGFFDDVEKQGQKVAVGGKVKGLERVFHYAYHYRQSEGGLEIGCRGTFWYVPPSPRSSFASRIPFNPPSINKERCAKMRIIYRAYSPNPPLVGGRGSY